MKLSKIRFWTASKALKTTVVNILLIKISKQ